MGGGTLGQVERQKIWQLGISLSFSLSALSSSPAHWIGLSCPLLSCYWHPPFLRRIPTFFLPTLPTLPTINITITHIHPIPLPICDLLPILPTIPTITITHQHYLPTSPIIIIIITINIFHYHPTSSICSRIPSTTSTLVGKSERCPKVRTLQFGDGSLLVVSPQLF